MHPDVSRLKKFVSVLLIYLQAYKFKERLRRTRKSRITLQKLVRFRYDEEDSEEELARFQITTTQEVPILRASGRQIGEAPEPLQGAASVFNDALDDGKADENASVGAPSAKTDRNTIYEIIHENLNREGVSLRWPDGFW